MYHRILLKLSGEALQDKENGQTLNTDKISALVKVIKEIHSHDIEVAIVVGAGNIWRGKFASRLGIDPAEADYMGMVGTVINSVAISSALKNCGTDSIVYSAIPVKWVTEPYDVKKAEASLKEGKVVVLGGGTGEPFFTTDTAASLRALELHCDVILAAKNGVDGVYTSDPNIDKDAKKYDILSYDEIIQKQLGVMDLSAIKMLRDTKLEIRVFSMDDVNNIKRVAFGENIGTIVRK